MLLEEVRTVSVLQTALGQDGGQTVVERLVSMIPLVLLLIGVVTVILLIVRTESKDCDLALPVGEPETVSGRVLYSTLIETRAYYKNNRRQMAIIFICAIISCFAGLTVLMISVFYFPDQAQTAGAAAGAVMSLVSGGFFWIFRQCSRQVENYFHALIRLQNIFIAVELCKNCSEPLRDEKNAQLIDALMKACENSPVAPIPTSEK